MASIFRRGKSKTWFIKYYSADISLLRVFFGSVCPSLELGKYVNRRFRGGDDERIKDKFRRRHVKASYLEDVTAEMIQAFISERIRKDKIAPKTANRQREILHRMFQYAIKTLRFVSPDRRYPNPAAAVVRRSEPAPQIRYQTAEQRGIDEVTEVCARVQSVLFWKYLHAGLAGLFEDMPDDSPGFDSGDAVVFKEDPDVMAFGLAAFDIGWQVVVLGRRDEIKRPVQVHRIEIHGQRTGSVLDQEVCAIRAIAVEMLEDNLPSPNTSVL